MMPAKSMHPSPGYKTCIARQLDHALAGVRDAGQRVRDMEEIQQVAWHMQQLRNIYTA